MSKRGDTIMIKRTLSGVVAFVMALSFAACGNGGGKNNNDNTKDAPAATAAPTVSTEEKNEINFWHFNNDEAKRIVDAFTKTYPRIKVKLTITPADDQQYINKLITTIKSGSGVPDVFSAESASVRKLVEMNDAFDDLTSKVDPIKADFAPYTLEVGSDKDGKIKALSHQVTTGGIGYKKLVAKKYLGTDDPQQVGLYFTSQEKMLEAGKKIKDASGGKVTLFPSWEELEQIYLGGRKNPWVKDNKFTIDQKMIDLIDFAKQLRNNGYEKGLKQFGNEWKASIADDESSLAYCIPTWGVPYIIGVNDKKASNGGRWGIVKGPFPFFWGGTWFGIYAKSEKKDLAWEFVRWFTADKEHLKEWNKETGDIPSSIPLLNEGATSEDTDKITGQNLFKFYAPDVCTINGTLWTTNDDVIQSAYLEYVRAYLSGILKDRNEVLNQLKLKVKANIKDVQVD